MPRGPIQQAVGRLCRNPVYTGTCVLTLALGIGSVVAIQAVIHASLLRPPAVPHLERLVGVYHSKPPASLPVVAFSWPDFLELRARQTVFDGLGATALARQVFAIGEIHRRGLVEAVSEDYFNLLGLTPEIGRLLQPGDYGPESQPAVVVSHRFWQLALGGHTDTLGSTVRVGGVRMTIVGVVQAPYRGLVLSSYLPTDIWLPLTHAVRTRIGPEFHRDLTDRNDRWIQVVGRLRPGRTPDDARRELGTIGSSLDKTAPIGDMSAARARHQIARDWTAEPIGAMPMSPANSPFIRPLLLAVWGLMVLVVVVVCTNIGSLTFARLSDRVPELGVRTALGASRARLTGELMVESCFLAFAGAVLALAVAGGLMTLLAQPLRVGEGVVIQVDPRFDAGLLLETSAVVGLALFVFGLIPAWRTTRDPHLRGRLSVMPRWRGRRGLIATQTAVSLILLSLASAAVGALVERARRSTGYALDSLAVIETATLLQDLPPDEQMGFASRLSSQVAQDPEIQGIAAISGLPGTRGSARAYLIPNDPAGRRQAVSVITVGPGALEVLGASITGGRGIEVADTRAARRVAVLSEAAAVRLFGTKAVVGLEVRLLREASRDEPEMQPESMVIVGVVRTAMNLATGRESFDVYVPLQRGSAGSLTIIARARENPERILERARRAVSAADDRVAITGVLTGEAFRSQEARFLQIASGLAGLLGIFALGIVLVGLLGLLFSSVKARTREIAVRIAVGAAPGGIVALVIGYGIRPVVLGTVIGLTLGLIARRAGPTLLVGHVASADAWTILILPVAVVAVSLAACSWPAAMAAKVQPNDALRHD